MARKPAVKKVEDEIFDEPVPDPKVVDADAFAALAEQFGEEEDDG